MANKKNSSSTVTYNKTVNAITISEGERNIQFDFEKVTKESLFNLIANYPEIQDHYKGIDLKTVPFETAKNLVINYLKSNEVTDPQVKPVIPRLEDFKSCEVNLFNPDSQRTESFRIKPVIKLKNNSSNPDDYYVAIHLEPLTGKKKDADINLWHAAVLNRGQDPELTAVIKQANHFVKLCERIKAWNKQGGDPTLIPWLKPKEEAVSKDAPTITF